MREHMGIFRGKRKDNGEWVQGFLYHFPQMGLCRIRYWCDLFAKYGDADVDPDTVGECTGLTDKHGELVFEGDIIQFHKFYGEPEWVGVVRYEHCLYMAVGVMPLSYEKRIGEKPLLCPFEAQISSIDKDTIEIIGNIHDNPELLKGGEG